MTIPLYFCGMIIYCFPLLAAFIGWIFNFVLVQYLFNKSIPAKIPALGAFAGKYGSEKVFNMDDLSSKLTDPKQLEAVRPFIEGHIDHFLNEKLKEKMPAIAMFIGDKTIVMMKAALMEEIDSLLPGLLQQFMGNISDKINLEKLLTDKLNALPEAQITAILNESLKKEKQMFQIFGALSGFVIGLVFVALFAYCK